MKELAGLAVFNLFVMFDKVSGYVIFVYAQFLVSCLCILILCVTMYTLKLDSINMIRLSLSFQFLFIVHCPSSLAKYR